MSNTPPDKSRPEGAAELWARMRSVTPARIGLGRAGDAMRTDALLDFQLAHAQARDAVLGQVDMETLAARIGAPTRQVHSAAPDRQGFIRRPDLGRVLDAHGRALLAADRAEPAWDAVFIVGDGLSSAAVEDHAAAMLQAVQPFLGGWRIAPIVLAEQARVALSDDIGAILNARLAVMLIGERPGLSVRNSLGIYLTFDPRPGRADSERNCISNIHANGLSYGEAARKLGWLMAQSFSLGGTGVFLKEAAGEEQGLLF